MFLPSIRISTFVNLRIHSVDPEDMIIRQHPSLGVKTKNNKSMETMLLPINELLEIVKEWHCFINEW